MKKEFMVVDRITKKGEYVDLTPEGAKKIKEKAKEANFTIIEGTPKTLLLDLDSWEAECRYDAMYSMLCMNFGAREKSRWKSKSGKGVHVVISLKDDLDETTRVALQAIMGSDPKREMFGIVKILNDVEEPSLLFKPPQKDTGTATT